MTDRGNFGKAAKMAAREENNMIQIAISIDRAEGMPGSATHLSKATQLKDAVIVALKSVAPGWVIVSPNHQSTIWAFPPDDVAGQQDLKTLLTAN